MGESLLPSAQRVKEQRIQSVGKILLHNFMPSEIVISSQKHFSYSN